MTEQDEKLVRELNDKHFDNGAFNTAIREAIARTRKAQCDELHDAIEVDGDYKGYKLRQWLRRMAKETK